MVLILPKRSLSPGLTINLRRQLPLTWNTAGSRWEALNLRGQEGAAVCAGG